MTGAPRTPTNSSDGVAIVELAAVELARRTRSGELSATEVMTAFLDRIDAVDGAIGAIVSRRSRDAVLADAATADRVAPAERGPLHGLPAAVKDLTDVAGLPTRSGSPLSSTEPVAADSLVASRLRAAGAIFVGKTNTPELGAGSHTFNPVFGPTRNPWNLSRSSGGSSGGAAAAVAARLLPVADGSDFGGSLRNPGAFCSVVGLRPSIGRVPFPVSHSTHLSRLGVHGPMGRTVADCAYLLSVLAGPDPRDPLSILEDPGRFADPLPDTTGARLAWAGDLGLFPCEPDVLAIARAAAARIVDAGGTFTEAAPDLGPAMSVFRVLRGVAFRDITTEMPDTWRQTKATIVDNIEYGLGLDIDDVITAERERAELHLEMVRFFGDFDVLAMPTTQLPPFPVDWEYPTEVAGQAMGDYLDWMASCCVITPTGCPAISIPAGFTADGLPVGLQLVAPVGADRALLEVAAALEGVLGLSGRRPPEPAGSPSDDDGPLV